MSGALHTCFMHARKVKKEGSWHASLGLKQTKKYALNRAQIRNFETLSQNSMLEEHTVQISRHKVFPFPFYDDFKMNTPFAEKFISDSWFPGACLGDLILIIKRPNFANKKKT